MAPSEVSPRTRAPLWLSAQANQPLRAHLPHPWPRPRLPAGGLITPRLKAAPFTQVQAPGDSGQSHDWDMNQKPARLLSAKGIVLARPVRASCSVNGWLRGRCYCFLMDSFIYSLFFFKECQLPPFLYLTETELL